MEQNTEDILEVWENPYDAATGRVDTTVTVVRRTPTAAGAASTRPIRSAVTTRRRSPVPCSR